jgi:hypothetical protein
MPPPPISSPSDPATGSFNGSHRESNFLAVMLASFLPSFRSSFSKTRDAALIRTPAYFREYQSNRAKSNILLGGNAII